MRLLFLAFHFLLIVFANVRALADAPKLKEISISLLEIDPKEIGSKARPERRRIIEAAMRLAVSERSDELARKGLKLSVETNDLFQSHESAATAVNKTLSGNSLVGIGLPTSYYAEHGGIALKGTNLAVISPFATSTKLESYSPNLILLLPTNRHSARALATFAINDVKPKKVVAIVPWDNLFSRDFYNELPESFKSSTNLIKILDDQQDLNVVSSQVNSIKPDTILLTTFPAFSGKIIRALHESGFRGKFIGPSSWGEGEGKPLHALTKDLPIQAFTVRETSEYFMTPQQETFIDRFNKVTGMTYSAEAGLYYDSANLAIDRIIGVGQRVDRSSFFEALQKKPYRCGIFANVCSRDKKGSSSISFKVVRLDGGKFSPYREIHIER